MNGVKLCIFVDFAKAFDMVCHKKLLYTLEQVVIRSSYLKLMENNLINRTQCVEIYGILSYFKTVSCGFPQGNVLFPVYEIYT